MPKLKDTLQEWLTKPVVRESFIKRLVCSACRRRFDVEFENDPTTPSLYAITVTCESCKHPNRVTIDESAATQGRFKVTFLPAS